MLTIGCVAPARLAALNASAKASNTTVKYSADGSPGLDRVLRDLDLLRDINREAKAVVQMTLTTLDEELCRIVEPNVCTTKRRVEVLKTVRGEGIPTVVWLCPILPYLNDSTENLDGLLDACAEAGVRGIVNFGMGLTLRDGDREYYYAALDRRFPGLKERYIRRYGTAYELPSPNERALSERFRFS